MLNSKPSQDLTTYQLREEWNYNSKSQYRVCIYESEISGANYRSTLIKWISYHPHRSFPILQCWVWVSPCKVSLYSNHEWYGYPPWFWKWDPVAIAIEVIQQIKLFNLFIRLFECFLSDLAALNFVSIWMFLIPWVTSDRRRYPGKVPC